ncbi:hypothetical protein ORM30_24030 [Bacillus cereus]|nr:hypothetical protein [Bacillus cereus]
MGKATAHKFGQMIGGLLEETMLKYLNPIAQKHNLYLDYKHQRSARGKKKEVIWNDINDNKHKLDIVFEKNGSDTEVGQPLAFIEMAWRRYTKHSKNKAQEIQGAIIPLIAKYNKYSPFYGAVIAGEFTQPSIKQMESVGFRIVYFEFKTIIDAFKTADIDVYWGEDTEDSLVLAKIEQYNKLNSTQKDGIIDKLIELNKEQLEEFVRKIDEAVLRKIEYIRVFSLHGNCEELPSVKEAYDYILSYDEENTTAPLVKYEILIRYNNGDRIEAQFQEKTSALAFLMEYQD